VSTTTGFPETLLEAVKYFTDPQVCIDFVAAIRWPNGPACPTCDGREHSYLTTRRVWKCKACKRQFSVKVGTIFEASPIGLDKWLPAVWLICNSKNGISSHELGRATGLTQKTAWFVLHRVRLAMKTGSFAKFDGTVEADETFVGGLAKNMHKGTKARRITGPNTTDKAVVVGTLQRGTDGGPSRVAAEVVPDRSRESIRKHVTKNVEPGASLYTDMWNCYRPLGDTYDHAVVDHMRHYVRGRVHTNGIENFWSLLKRGLHGSYVKVDQQHLFRYVDERVFTFNNRELDDLGRFRAVLRHIAGRRLTYAELTGA
jgi:transposase-like protein